jgi:peptidoglycan-associated lipoprotein
MKYIPTSLFTAVAAVVLAACSSTPDTPSASLTAAVTPPPSTARAPANPTPTASSTVATVVIPAHKDPKSTISMRRSVYFDYDDFSVKAEFGSVVEQHAKYLQTNPVLTIRVEGNADERGSAEYNLALGQKRAQAVVNALRIYGAKDAQMEAVSYGEEKPNATAGDESAWAQNRRADIAYRN